MEFEWHATKDLANQRKHGVSFGAAQRAFLDRCRVVAVDQRHSTKGETRYFCFGRVDGRVMTVRFTVRGNAIRIFGAGYWREGRKRYDEENSGS